MTTNVFETVQTTGIKTWKSSGGDGVFTFTSVANAAGRQGDRVDLGDLLSSSPAARSTWYRWDAQAKFQASGLVVGNTCDLYLGWWNDDAGSANPDGRLGTADAAMSTIGFLRNLKQIGSLVVDDVTGGTILSRSGMTYIPVRRVAPLWWNATGATASATATDFQFRLTPVNPQLQ